MALKIQGSGYTSKVSGRGWNDNINWPTTPENEVAVRDRLQSQHDQTIDYVNDYLNYYTDTGTANTIVITPDPAFAAYSDNMALYVNVANACTGAVTINVNGLGAKTIKKLGNIDLVSGDIVAGQIIHLKYDGTNFQMLNEGIAPYTNLTNHLSSNIHIGTNPACKLYRNTAIWNATISLTKLFDTDNMYNSANPTRITIQTPGIYQIGTYVRGNYSNPGGTYSTLISEIRQNGGSTILVSDAKGPEDGINIYSSCQTIAQFAQGDYIELYIQATTYNLASNVNISLYAVRIA